MENYLKKCYHQCTSKLPDETDKAQGAIEYLLIIGAAILVVAIVIISLTSLTGSGTNTIDDEQVNNVYNPLDELKDKLVNPKISLLGTTNNGLDYNFEFSLDKTNGLSECSLIIENEEVGAPLTTINVGNNLISYSFTKDALTHWTINCTKEEDIITTSQQEIEVNQSPYQITNCIELQEMNLDVTGSYELMNDIDCSQTKNWNKNGDINLGWDPISAYKIGEPMFQGTLEGNYKKIVNLYANSIPEDVDPNNSGGSGLFYGISNAEIKNLGLIDVNISGYDYTGGLVGGGYNSTITNVYVTGNINGTNANNVGGIIGHASDMQISQSYNLAKVIGGEFSETGGIAGGLFSGETNSIITNSYNKGLITSNQIAGGIVGRTDGPYEIGKTPIIRNSYNSGKVITTNSLGSPTGGILGVMLPTTVIENSFNIGEVTNTDNYGGIASLVVVFDEPDFTSINNYWDTSTTNQTNCYFLYGDPSSPSDLGCTQTNNELSKYYSEIPNELNWSTSIWTITDSALPKLAWE